MRVGKRRSIADEMQIPIFMVSKKGSILKKIFLNVPPPVPLSESHPQTDCENSSWQDSRLLVGRHPDCHIILDHPSISRVHLEISLKPSLQKLYITDLCSVHGTWISNQKIPSKIPRELSEGDEFRLGFSTRVYRLHWVLLSQAHEIEKSITSSDELNGKKFDPCPDEDCEQLNKGNGGGFQVDIEIPFSSPFPKYDKLIRPGEVHSSDERVEHMSDQVLENKNLEMLLEIRDNSVAGSMASSSPFKYVKESLLMDENMESMQFNPASLAPNKDNLSLPSIELHNDMPSSSPYPSIKCLLDDGPNTNQNDLSMRVHAGKKTLLENGKNIEEIPISSQFVKSASEIDHFPSATMHNAENPPSRKIFPDIETRDSLRFLELNYLQMHESLVSSLVHNDNQLDRPDAGRQLVAESERENQRASASLLDQIHLEESESVNTSLYINNLSQSNRDLGRNIHSLDVLNMGEVPTFPRNADLSSPQESCSSNLLLRRKKSSSFLRIETTMSMIKWITCSDTQNKAQSPNNDMAVSVSETNKSFSEFPFASRRGGEDKKGGEESATSDIENKASTVSIFTPNSNMKNSLRFKRVDLDNSTGNVLVTNLDMEVPIATMKDDMRNAVSESIINSGKTIRAYGTEGELNNSPVKYAVADFSLQDEIFSSDKENLTPEFQHSRRLKNENSTRVNLDEANKRRFGRMPFQTIFMEPSKSNSMWVSNATSNINGVVSSTQSKKCRVPSPAESVDQVEESVRTTSVNHPIGQINKKWNMVVDTGSLLDKESLKSLKLLQGLKGTCLFVPRIVLRELDCLKRRENWFKKANEVSSILQWIEECMVKTKWWIHVQSSTEGVSMSPTPPHSPHSWLSEGNNGFGCGITSSSFFPKRGNLMDIVSPTAEDHILECALLFKNTKPEEKLILLSNDVSLRIKAMAEGLLCETAGEFRESLVNPFSDRFMWTDSSPRGQTWSTLDEASGLKECFCHGLPAIWQAPWAKGLKLVLLHSSHKGQAE